MSSITHAAFNIPYERLQHRTSYVKRDMSTLPVADLMTPSTMSTLRSKARTHEAIMGRIYSSVWKASREGYQCIVLENHTTGAFTAIHLSVNRMREKIIFITESETRGKPPTHISFGFQGTEAGYEEFRNKLFVSPDKCVPLSTTIQPR